MNYYVQEDEVDDAEHDPVARDNAAMDRMMHVMCGNNNNIPRRVGTCARQKKIK